jgi:hypothetical protein
MKPRIFINTHCMEIGGAERALLGLLNAIDTDKVDVDLFVNRHSGEFMKLIPQKINLLPENKRYASVLGPIKDAAKQGYWDIVLARVFGKIAHKLFLKHVNLMPGTTDASMFHYWSKYTTPLLPSLYKYGEYDLAISFLAPHQIVAHKVNSRKKVAWIHTDYTISRVNVDSELSEWNAYDNIVSISPDVTKTFTDVFPSLAHKIIEIENILSPAFVRAQAEMEDVSAEIGQRK